MRYLFALVLFSMLAAGCGNAPTPVRSNTAATPANERSDSMIAHGPTVQATPATAERGEKAKWTQSGDPIDTTALDAAVAKAEKAVKSKPNDEAAKKAASAAYFDRGSALTEARQYASALGDYRKAYKLDPSNTDAKGWIEKIIQIYDGLNKSYPGEGEEPPPLPFKKQ